MKPDVANRLIEVNRQFYQRFAAEFSATRGRVNPGVARALDGLAPGGRVLDLGCGNGSVAKALHERGFEGEYVGVDLSEGLLAEAKAISGFRFVIADLTADDWVEDDWQGAFDVALSFATMHHLPGEASRLAFLRQVRECLSPGGVFIHSHWQFLNSEKLRGRLQDWARIGLTAGDVDEGDHLLDWRSGGEGLRYVHHFSEAELAALAAQSGFEVRETFHSDGDTGDLGLYQVWTPTRTSDQTSGL